MNSGKRLSLLVMAAGMGSRYGGIKQIECFGPNGETIMDYSLFDAVDAGFDKIVFVVREEIKGIVQEMFLAKLKDKVEVYFEVQSLERFLPEGVEKPVRQKPWGTAHAVLCGKEVINGPFAVINADDFYGREAFRSLASFLNYAPETHHAMVGYPLKNVLSPFGGVSRGIAEEVSMDGYLKQLTEVKDIVAENGRIISRENNVERELMSSMPVSMNCWGFQPGIFELAEKLFADFAKENIHNPAAEFYIASVVTELIRRNIGKVQLIDGGQNWMGVTYKNDKSEVISKVNSLIESGVYPDKLW